MFEGLKERLGIKPEAPPTDEELVGRIDRYLWDEQRLRRAIDMERAGDISGEEFELYSDLEGHSRDQLARMLAKLGLWEKSEDSSLPTVQEVIDIRARLAPDDENSQNVVSMDEYRRKNGHQ